MSETFKNSGVNINAWKISKLRPIADGVIVIDMNFGTDLIMGRQDMGWKTIQVKRNEGAWDKSKKYYYVDWVIIADPFTIYDNKTKQPVEL